jgi:hypothetical protein
MQRPLTTLITTLLAAASAFATAQGTPMERTSLIVSRPFDVKVLANGVDVTSRTPVVSVKYNADGSGTRTLRDGKTIDGQWKFLNAAQTQIEVHGPEGTSRWVIIEINERIYRKANMDTGVEFVHLPRQP